MPINFNIIHTCVSINNTNAYKVLSDSHKYFYLQAIFVLSYLQSLMYSLIDKLPRIIFCTHVCMYVHMYVCMYVYMHIHIYIHVVLPFFIHPYIHVCLHPSINTCMQIHVCMSTYMHIYL